MSNINYERLKYTKILIVIIVIICAMASCQPTPPKEIVVNKADGDLQKTIESTSVPTGEMEIEKRWETTLQNENVTININAEIIIPEDQVHSILSIVSMEMDQKIINDSLNVLFKGVTPYENIGETKQTIEKQILNNKRVMEKIQAGNCPYGFTEKDYGLLYQRNQALLSMHDTAPDETELKLVPANTEINKGDNGVYLLQMIGKVSDSYFANLIIMNNNITKTNYVNFSNYNNDVSGVRSNDYNEGTPLSGVSITMEEALSIAEETITKMGITDVVLIEKNIANFFDVMPIVDIEGVQSEYQAYEFKYAKSYNGMLIYDLSSMMVTVQDEVDPKFSAVLSPETLNVRVDDSGVVFFDWKNPTYCDGIINENVELLDFGEIQEIFSTQIFYYCFDIVDIKIDIDKVVLSYFVQPEINNNSEYIAIPVWDFIGMIEIDGEPVCNLDIDMTFMTINAIDGSIIDRSKGY